MREGSYVNFLSDAHGVPEPEFSWIKDGTPLAEGDRISFLRRNKQLRITGVEKEDSGKYQCVASNEVNTRVTSDPAMLKVEGNNTFAYLILEPSSSYILQVRIIFTWILSYMWQIICNAVDMETKKGGQLQPVKC